MRGSLGEKIGEGAFSDVHAWAPGQVVKLFKAGVSQRLSRRLGHAGQPRVLGLRGGIVGARPLRIVGTRRV